MNPEQALNQIEKVIAEREPSKTGRYYICFALGGLDCVPTDIKPKPWPILAQVNESNLQGGLSVAMWNHIQKRLALLLNLEMPK